MSHVAGHLCAGAPWLSNTAQLWDGGGVSFRVTYEQVTAATGLKSHSPISSVSNVLIFVFLTSGQSIVSEFGCGKRRLFIISLKPTTSGSQPAVTAQVTAVTVEGGPLLLVSSGERRGTLKRKKILTHSRRTLRTKRIQPKCQ